MSHLHNQSVHQRQKCNTRAILKFVQNFLSNQSLIRNHLRGSVAVKKPFLRQGNGEKADVSQTT